MGVTSPAQSFSLGRDMKIHRYAMLHREQDERAFAKADRIRKARDAAYELEDLQAAERLRLKSIDALFEGDTTMAWLRHTVSHSEAGIYYRRAWACPICR
jgi:hypothetical protein